MRAVMVNKDTVAGFDPFANIRTDCYILLASLLGNQPTEEICSTLHKLEWDEAIPGELNQALTALRRAAHDCSLADMKDEFDRLFVGLGCGESIPYASWYKEKTIQWLPLVPLRSDLARFGIVRQPNNHEPEDHAAALCEVMAILSKDANGSNFGSQASFFQEHIASWIGNFFNDLQSAKSSVFYRTVGLFGSCFLELEGRYLKCCISLSPNKKGRRKRT